MNSRPPTRLVRRSAASVFSLGVSLFFFFIVNSFSVSLYLAPGTAETGAMRREGESPRRSGNESFGIVNFRARGSGRGSGNTCPRVQAPRGGKIDERGEIRGRELVPRKSVEREKIVEIARCVTRATVRTFSSRFHVA